jgi:Ion channel
MKAFRNLRLMGIALALPTLIGFHFLEGWPWFDGFCIGITGFTTIGYQEVHPPSHSGGVFKVALIRAGGSLMWLSIGLLTQALLEFELRSFLGGARWNVLSNPAITGSPGANLAHSANWNRWRAGHEDR